MPQRIPAFVISTSRDLGSSSLKMKLPSSNNYSTWKMQFQSNLQNLMKAFIISRQRSCRAGTPPRWQSNKHQLWLTDAMAAHPQNFTPGKLRTFDFAITCTTYQLKAYWCAARMPVASSRLIWRANSDAQDTKQTQQHRSAFFGWRNNT